ncbi:hypothetical protein M9Y10_044294 [Tritrichomonas musculus]|uniref:BTB domain-containing protein n=1 Tax=Tritrichomonas musculus TaxID=1915356 RepID=A0ABR2K218_9EUKA
MFEITNIESFVINQTFTLINGNHRYIFKGDLFAKMSKKCASLLDRGITEGRIMRKVDKDTFKAFVSACNLKPFQINSKNAYELLYLSSDWGISSLEKFANDYINSKNIQPPDPIDYVQILVDKTSTNTTENEDILAVAANINDAMEDDRFMTLPPEVIFETLLSADPHEIDADKLLNFTMTLFDKKPSTGIPLTFLINFEKLAPEQRSKIFRSRKMHEIDLNYFIAWAFSEIRNRAAESTTELINRCFNKIYKEGEELKIRKKADKEQYRESHRDELAALTNQINEQRQELEELIQLFQKDFEEERQAEERRQETLRCNQEDVKEIETSGEDCNIAISGTANMVKNEVKDQISNLRTELNKELESVSHENESKCNDIINSLQSQIEEQANIITKLQKRTEDLKNVVDGTNADIREAKCALANKVVRDKLRHDDFIRENKRRFEIFSHPFSSQQEWEITPEDAENAERFIENLEADLQRLCPIRGNTKNSPPSSPKMISSKLSKNRLQSPLAESDQDRRSSRNSSGSFRNSVDFNEEETENSSLN